MCTLSVLLTRSIVCIWFTPYYTM